MTAAAVTLLLAFNVSANAFDGSSPPASDSTQLLTIATPRSALAQPYRLAAYSADLAPRRIGIPRFKPEREVTIDTPLVDATVQNTPGYSDQYPAGVPKTFAWCGGSYRPPNNRAPPPDFTAVTGWGQIYPAIGAAEYSTLDPVIEVANSRTYVHLKGRNGWVLVQSQARIQIAGAHFVSDFSKNAAIRMEIRQSPGGAAMIGAPPPGYNSHFWLVTRGTYPASSVDGVYVQMDMRSADPALNVVANVGADWWRNATAAFEDGFGNNPGAGMSNWLTLSTQWSTLRFYSTSNDDLWADPPPPLLSTRLPYMPTKTKRRDIARIPCSLSRETQPQ